MTTLRQTGRAESRTQKTDGEVKLTTFIPVRFVRHKAKKVVVHPTTDGRLATPAPLGSPTTDAALMRALARGLFWQQLLDEGKVTNIAELAAAEDIDKVRVQKTLKLARLAPDVVDDIARGRQPVGLALEFFVRNPLPDDWSAQRQSIADLAG